MFIFAVDSFIKRDIGRNARILLGGIYGALILFLAFSFFLWHDFGSAMQAFVRTRWDH